MTTLAVVAAGVWQATTTAPLFTADMSGFIKILALLATVVLLPCAALIVGFLKSGATRQVDALKQSIELQVNTLRTGMEAQVAILSKELNGYGGRLNSDEANLRLVADSVAGIRTLMQESARDTSDAFRASAEALQKEVAKNGEATLRALHAMDLRVQSLEDRAEFSSTMKDVCSAVESLARAVAASTLAQAQAQAQTPARK